MLRRLGETAIAAVVPGSGDTGLIPPSDHLVGNFSRVARISSSAPGAGQVSRRSPRAPPAALTPLPWHHGHSSVPRSCWISAAKMSRIRRWYSAIVASSPSLWWEYISFKASANDW
jgi:hypothetical protein